MMTMPDWILILILLLGLGIGWRLGLVHLLVGAGSYVVGYLAAREFSGIAAEWLGQQWIVFAATDGSQQYTEVLKWLSLFIDPTAAANRLVQIVCWVLIFVLVSWLIKKIAAIFSGMFKGTILGLLDSTLGAIVTSMITITVIAVVCSQLAPMFYDTAVGVWLTTFAQDSKVVYPVVVDLSHIITYDVYAALEKVVPK